MLRSKISGIILPRCKTPALYVNPTIRSHKQSEKSILHPSASMSTVPETLNWQQLFAELRPLISSGDAHEPTINYLLGQYRAKEADFKRYVHFDAGNYTKNLVEDFGQHCNVIIMCWAPGQASTFHGHEGSKCFVKVLAGELIEQQVDYPRGGGPTTPDSHVVVNKRRLKINQVTYIDDDVGIHQVSNASREQPAITLHIYMPAYKKCRVFGDSDKLSIEQSQSVRVTFHSRFGMRGFGDK